MDPLLVLAAIMRHDTTMDAIASGSDPRKVLLFSGHMIDAPGRAVPRFPPRMEPLAADALARLLDELEAGGRDLAICGGACGGDLLFAEAALARSVALEIYLPLDEATFLARSMDFAGDHWHARYLAARSKGSLHLAPDEERAVQAGGDAYERNNHRMLAAASRFGAERVDFICLWDGQSGDGPGGTRHMMQEVTRRRGRTHRLDPTLLWS